MKFLLILLFLFPVIALSQTDTTKKEVTKKGWTFGAVPAIAYDTDLGFKYGGLINLYNYGDGKNYPKYNHSIYMEWSRTTKGSGINTFRYDSEHLIPKTRVMFEASYLTNMALGFYGFNGAKTNYFPTYENDNINNTFYRSRLYYRYDRKLTRIKLDFQRKFPVKNMRWMFGMAHYNAKITSIDTTKLNSGLSDDKKLPSVNGLYDNYIAWGAIKPDQKNGGIANLIKLGAIYDTRDQEANPMKGIWSEILVVSSNKFLGSSYSFTKLAITHRQYFTLKKDVLNFAYRLSYQPTISGEIPFYMLPFIYNTDVTRDGLGGAKTVRGILLNRIVGQDVAYGNFEFRWKFLRTVIKKQNLYLALNPFLDMGIVTRDYNFDKSKIPLTVISDNEDLHLGYGMGLKIVLNQNFVVSVDYGLSNSENDGKSGLYITIGFLY